MRNLLRGLAGRLLGVCDIDRPMSSLVATLMTAIVTTLGGVAAAVELPWWVDSISVTQPVPQGSLSVGAVTLSGTWIDTGAPDAIGHTFSNGALHLSVSAPDLNVATGDALTPWTLTEEFLFTDPSVNEIRGSIFSVDPANRGNRLPVSVDDFLGYLFPPPQGVFEGLGTGVSSAYVSRATDVSADGRVVTGRNELAPGAAGFLTSEAFAWAPETGRVTLGTLGGGNPGGSSGLGVSADGNHIVGGTVSNANPSVDYEAFRWQFGTGMQGLGTINGASSTSEARATSHDGRVTVGVDDFFPPVAAPFFNGKRAFRHTDEGGMEDLGLLPEYAIADGSSTEAVDVSADGSVVVGTARRGELSLASPTSFPGPSDASQPFRWTEDDGMQGLGNLPRFFPAFGIQPPQETIANAVSADGSTVVGEDRVLPLPFDDSIYPYRSSAVLWTENGGWTDLGELRLPPGPEQVGAEAIDVSLDGSVVIGEALLGSTDALIPGVPYGEFDEFGLLQVPFIWDEARGMRPLERVLAGDYGLDFEGWTLGEAAAISDDGTTIVGTGTNPDGFQEAWRAVLHRDTRTGDADFDGDVDTDDYDAIMANLGTLRNEFTEVYYADGDFNGDGAIAFDDLDLLLANYDGRSQGDFNADGVVDTADYTLWRDHDGQQTGIADSNGDGWADSADLATWRANFGTVLGSGTPVPEPATLAWAALASIAVITPRVKRS